jgi:topoisomerase-4 subunit A
MVYNLVYLDGKTGRSMIKRFNVKGITRDKEYDLTKGAKGSKLLYFTANPNGEAEVITVNLTSRARARIKIFDFDFSSLEIKGRGAGGNILTKYPVRKIQFKSEGRSTLGGVDLYYDDSIGRLNRDERGKHLGNFNAEDSILVIYSDGVYELTSFELTNRYEYEKVKLIEKFNSEITVTAIYLDGSSKITYIKKFNIETTTQNKKFPFISESKGSKLLFCSSKNGIKLKVDLKKKRKKETEDFSLDELVGVKGWKAVGNKFTSFPITKITEVEGEEIVIDQKIEIVESTSINEHKEISSRKDQAVKKEPIETKEIPAEIAAKEADNASGGDALIKSKAAHKSAKPNLESKEDEKPKKEMPKKEEEPLSGDESSEEEGFHSGDTIEMDIDVDKIKKQKGQFGLFDE